MKEEFGISALRPRIRLIIEAGSRREWLSPTTLVTEGTI